MRANHSVALRPNLFAGHAATADCYRTDDLFAVCAVHFRDLVVSRVSTGITWSQPTRVALQQLPAAVELDAFQLRACESIL